MEPRIIRVGELTEVRFFDGWVETHYHYPALGVRAVAVPQDDEEYKARARELGYADGATMNREHDACHSILCCWLGLPLSPTIYGVASGEPAAPVVRWWEEGLVLAFQAWLNLGRYDPCLAILPRLDRLAAHATSLLRP